MCCVCCVCVLCVCVCVCVCVCALHKGELCVIVCIFLVSLSFPTGFAHCPNLTLTQFFPAGENKKRGGEEYQGGRELEDFKSFLQTNAKSLAGKPAPKEDL